MMLIITIPCLPEDEGISEDSCSSRSECSNPLVFISCILISFAFFDQTAEAGYETAMKNPPFLSEETEAFDYLFR